MLTITHPPHTQGLPLLAKQRGSSLIEALLALLILSLTFLSLSSMQAGLISSNDFAKQHTQATGHAQQKIEELRNFNGVSSGAVTYASIVSGNDSLAGENTNYQRSWIVVEDTSLNHKTVTVTVSWSDKDNSNNSVSLSSIISKSDPYTNGRIFLS